MLEATSIIATLLRERAGYLARGLTDRVTQVDAQLAHYGHQVERSDKIETAADSATIETAVKRGRPRKAD